MPLLLTAELSYIEKKNIYVTNPILISCPVNIAILVVAMTLLFQYQDAKPFSDYQYVK